VNHYTYLWLREDGTPYYAGKGMGRRAFISYGHRFNRPRDPERIIVQDWPSEEMAFGAERFLIAAYGRLDQGAGCLRNLSDGGEGATGMTHSAETRRKIGAAHRGNTTRRGCTLSAETRRKISEAKRGSRPTFLGRSHSPESREKLRLAGLGRLHSAESRRKMSIAKRGVPKSADTRRRMSEAQRGNAKCLGHRHTLASRQKMSAAQKGRAVSSEHRRRISVAMKARYRRLRGQ